MGDLALPLASYGTGSANLGSAGELALMVWYGRGGGLTSSATMQPRIQGSELACSNIYELLQRVKGASICRGQSYRSKAAESS